MRYALSVLGLAASIPMLSPVAVYGGTGCDPMWSSGFEAVSTSGNLMDTVEFDDGSGPAVYGVVAGNGTVRRFKNGTWEQVGTPFFANASGASRGTLYDLAVYNGELYVCGSFRRVGTTGVTTPAAPANLTTNCVGVAKWSPSTGIAGSWVPATTTNFVYVLTGVRALAVQDFGSGPKLYAAGKINNNLSVAMYNGGTSWTILSNSFTGATEEIRSMVARTIGGVPQLLIGGTFAKIGTVNAPYLAAYNGTDWSAVNIGLASGNTVSQIEAIGSDIFIAGSGLVPPVREAVPWGIARWDGSTLHPVTNLEAISPQSRQMFRLNHDGVNPGETLFINRGIYREDGQINYVELAKWNGSGLTDVVPGAQVEGIGLVSFDADGAGAGPRRLMNIAAQSPTPPLNRSTLQLVDGEWADGLGYPYSRGFISDTIIEDPVVRDPDGAGPEGAELIGMAAGQTRQGAWLHTLVRYDGGFIEPFGEALSVTSIEPNPEDTPQTNYSVMTVLGSDIYVGGSFTHLGNVPVGNIVKWNGTAWEGLAGGVFNTLESKVAAHNVSAMAADEAADVLYVGGSFTQAGGSIPANYVARWDGAAWSALGAGLPGPATSLVMHNDGTGTTVYAATRPINQMIAGEDPGVFKWNGTQWDRIASTGYTPGVALGTVLASYNGELYLGGFPMLDGASTYNNIARWNGTNWNTVGAGIPLVEDGSRNHEYISAFYVGNDGSGEALFIGGKFNTIDGVTMGGITKWNGTGFSSLGGGLVDREINFVSQAVTDWFGGIRGIAVYDDGRGPGVFVSGKFTYQAGQNLSVGRFGRYGVNRPLILEQPVGVEDAEAGSDVELSIVLDASIEGDIQWQRNGADVAEGGAYGGVTSQTLTITNISAAQAGTYTAVVTGDCGETVSAAAVVSVEAPACPADFNGDNARDVADLFAYINAWLAKTPNADFNNSGGVDVADLFAYINAWLAGC